MFQQGRLVLPALAILLSNTVQAERTEPTVAESARRIPVAYQVDVVVVGGSSAAVAAAAAASDAGASVFLAAPRPYLGDDLAGTLRLTLAPGQVPEHPLAEQMFGKERSTSPLTVKRVLDQALVDRDVSFLFGCFPTNVLRDASGLPAGVVIANRAGRQAVLAKVIVDATRRATVARLAGAEGTPWPAGVCTFERTVVVPGAAPAEAQQIVVPIRLPMPDGSFQAFAAAEQAARAQTYRDDQVRASESLFLTPPDRIASRTTAPWNPEKPDIDRFRPAGVDRLFVLGGCSDVPRDAMASLLHPTGLMQFGQQIGSEAARMAAGLPNASDVHLPATATPAAMCGEVRELLRGVHSTSQVAATVTAEPRATAILGDYDVVVIGGGTSGAAVAIGAVRQGARTLVVEYQEGLGGIGTLGLISRPYHGKNVGFSQEVPFPTTAAGLEAKMEWYRRQIAESGGEIWLGAIGCGVLVEGDRITGAVVATPQGRGIVRAHVVVDATGNADLVAAAGGETVYGCNGRDIALQGTGLPTRPLTGSYVNTDYLLVEEGDIRDVWAAMVGVRMACPPDTYDVGPLIQNRERRRIVGDHVLRYLDQIVGRTYPDSIVHSASDYDSHGYPSQPFFALMPHDTKSLKANHPAPGGSCFTPYRCLLPRHLDGILVVGLGISMERDASAMVRMQRDLQNQGYAAGVAAAMIARRGGSTRELDIRKLQEHLVAVGNLPAEVLQQEDNIPFDTETVAAAVGDLTAGNRRRAAQALAVVLRHRDTAEPMLLAAFRSDGDSGRARLTYAKILGFWGHTEVVPCLADALANVPHWDDKILQGVMAEYAHLPTPVDALVLSLGPPRDARALPAILRMLDKLDAQTTLSHHRACALSLEQIAAPVAAEPLARLLEKPGMRGHAMTSLEPLHQDRNLRRREGALREIVLARALYRCDDWQGTGRAILQEYATDLRGLFARHAQAVLAESESQ